MATEAEKRRLVKAMGKLTAEELTELYVCGDWDVHGATLTVFHRRRADALAQGLRLARSRTVKRREKSYWLIAVGDDGSGVADNALAVLVEDGEASVAGAAVQGLSILQVGRSSHEVGPRFRAKPGEATFPWPEPLPAFIDLAPLAAAASYEDAGVRMHVAMALWMCGEPEATRLLVALSADPDEDVRSAALGSMGWKRFSGGVTPEVIEALWNASRDASPHVRATAATSLVKLEQRGARERFIEALQ